MSGTVAIVDFDTATYIGDEDDGVYFATAEGPDGWYVSTAVDCNTSGFTDTLVSDDGPYANEAEAQEAGKNAALNWCLTNGVEFDEAG